MFGVFFWFSIRGFLSWRSVVWRVFNDFVGLIFVGRVCYLGLFILDLSRLFVGRLYFSVRCRGKFVVIFFRRSLSTFSSYDFRVG